MTPTSPRILSPSRRRRRRSFLPPAAALFCCGFLFGRGGAPSPGAAVNPLPPAQPPAQTAQAFPSPGESPSAVVTPAPSPAPGENGDWSLILVNRDSPLPQGFSVPELTSLRRGHAVDSRIYAALQDMMDAARSAGHSPLICSSYRSQEKQEELFERKVEEYMDRGYSREEAETRAAAWVSPPGTSEHQAGLAVDIVDLDYQLLDQAQEDRPVQQWLMEHCWEYGFILRYPTDKSHLTGVEYEPWHYRYVGVEAAREITEGGLCLEEYLDIPAG